MNWKLKERDTGMYTIFEVIDEDGNNNNKNHNLIARFVTDDKDYTEIKKKAQLIVAAPELLNVAEYSLKIVENLPCECDSYNGFTCKKHEWERKLRKAINKAKGADE